MDAIVLRVFLSFLCVTGPRPQLPIEGPWRHGSLKGFLKNVDLGKEETGEIILRNDNLLDKEK